MEENPLPESYDSQESTGCTNCGSSAVLEGYSNRLCNECRQLYIKYPIPLWVKLFAAAVAIVMLFSLFTFPKSVSLGLHLEKGRRLEQKRQYLSAQRELEAVTKLYPDNIEANGYLMIAAFYNMDYKTLVTAQSHLENREIEDADLYGTLNDLVNRVDHYYPDTTISNLIDRYGTDEKVPDTVWNRFITRHPHSIYAFMSYANILYDRHDYGQCDSLLNLVLAEDGFCLGALRMLACSQREQRLWDKSIASCQKILQLNQEAGYAFAIMSRTYLKQEKNALGLDLAQKALAVNSTDPYNVAHLAVAWHYNNEPSKRDALLKELKAHKDSASILCLERAEDIIQHKEKL